MDYTPLTTVPGQVRSKETISQASVMIDIILQTRSDIHGTPLSFDRGALLAVKPKQDVCLACNSSDHAKPERSSAARKVRKRP
jgi:hypothetical protein